MKSLLPLLCSITLLSATPPSPIYEVVPDLATLPILNPSMEGRCVEKLLLPNGLQVFLVSDPGAEQSAAGVAVEVGSWDDPKTYPGMAHFCEHMLFMGTAAYPNEFEYMQFITDHGGSVNAFTASDRTCYMFSINNDGFEEALDRFSHFFIDPLFSPHCINRELHAVDQEHAKNIEHDGWRQYMILKETGNPHHPNASFSTGNAQTLSGIPQSALKEWYESHYSADRMHLAIVSPLPLEELKALASQDFSKVPTCAPDEHALPARLTSAQQRGHMIFIQPVKDIKQLSLNWEVPKTFATDIDRQIPALIAYALNQEGPNSLAQALKKEALAESVHAGCDRFNKDSLLFTIDIALTDEGIAHTDTVILRVFQAIARLKKEGYPSHLFQEVQMMAKLNYQYQSREDAYMAIVEAISDMSYEDLNTYPIKTKIPSQFDPAAISTFMDTLRSEECLYFILADPVKTHVTPDIQEKWMNAQYAIRTLTPEQLTAWNDAGLSSAIQLPMNNPYIPTALSLIPMAEHTRTEPILLCSDDTAKIFYAEDVRYHVPEISFLFTFKSPLIDNSARAAILSDLYVRALNEKLSSVLSMASCAGLSTCFGTTDYEIRLRVNGYSDKAPLLLQEIFSSLKQVTPSQEQFEIYRASLAADYDNASKELPVRQAMEELDGILFNTPTHQQKHKAIQTLTYEEFLTFSKQLWTKCYTEGMLYGNLTQDKASHLWNDLKQEIGALPFPKQEHYRKQVLLLSEKDGPYKLVQQTDRQGSGALLLLEEGDFTFEKRAIQQVLGSALSDAFFDTLRTKQQTGYIAKAWNTEEERQLLQFFAVQSSTHAPGDLLARFELFLESFDKNISLQIPEGRFESIRSSLITVLKMPPENMASMAALWNQLAFEYGDFLWLQKRVESLETLKYDRFCTVAHQLLSRSNPRRLAVLMEGTLTPENDFRYELITKEGLRDVGTFVSVQ